GVATGWGGVKGGKGGGGRGLEVFSCRMGPALGKSSGRSTTPLSTLNIAVLAPTPRVNVTTATAANDGLRVSVRRAKRRSWSMAVPTRTIDAQRGWNVAGGSATAAPSAADSAPAAPADASGRSLLY